MDAQELRIGNLVTINNPKHHPKLKGVILEVTGIQKTLDFDGNLTYGVSLKHPKEKPKVYYETYSQFLCFIEPIPLTEEWLVKFGFEKSKYEYFTKFAGNNVLTIFIYQERIKVDIVNQFICNIHFLHQLQNLYFALTNKELTV